MNPIIFATCQDIQDDEDIRRDNHGKIWSNYELQLLRVEINAGKLTALQIAKELKRSINGICLKAKYLGLLTYDNLSSCYYVAREITNPCTEIQIPTTKETMTTTFKTQTIVFDEIIETAHADRLLTLLRTIHDNFQDSNTLGANDNGYLHKQFETLSLAKAAVLAELEKRA